MQTMSLRPSTHSGLVASMPQASALSTAARSRILLAWEHGRNLGHLSRLSAIARRVEAQGAQPVWAVPPAFLQAPQLKSLPHPRHAAPMMRPDTPLPSQRIDSYADILLSFGFADTQVLGRAVRAWLKLFEVVQADSIVLDYAPAAQLAAQLLGLPAFQITNGFDAPPPDCPIFGIAVRGPYLERLNAQKLTHISTALNQVGQDVMGQPGPSLEAYFNHPTRVFDCIAQTDPYGPREHGFYVGPLATLQNAEAACWPDHAANQTPVQIPGQTPAPAPTPKLFAYLRDVPNTGEWLAALGSAQASTLCVWPDATDELIAQHSNTHLRIARHPVDMDQALAQADAVLNYGSTTTVAQALLAGKPQLMLPQDIEKTLVARKVVQYGAGLLWGKRSGTCAEALHQLLSNSSLPQKAQAIAAQFPTARRLHRQKLFVQALIGKIELKKDDMA
jgi:UDP:flavonoid glycosyltransferase YjiC (YdhE family)